MVKAKPYVNEDLHSIPASVLSYHNTNVEEGLLYQDLAIKYFNIMH